jgi:hypothetical protein
MSVSLSDQIRIACPTCDANVRTPLPDGTERVEFNPDGLVRAICADCGEGLAVGFRRTDD